MATFLRETFVEDLPGIGGVGTGDELPDRADGVESLRGAGRPCAAKIVDEAASAECEGGTPSSPRPT